LKIGSTVNPQTGVLGGTIQYYHIPTRKSQAIPAATGVFSEVILENKNTPSVILALVSGPKVFLEVLILCCFSFF
jgi:hypothetical protein